MDYSYPFGEYTYPGSSLALGAGDVRLPSTEERLAEFIHDKFDNLTDAQPLRQQQYHQQFPNGVQEELSSLIKACIDNLEQFERPAEIKSESKWPCVIL